MENDALLQKADDLIPSIEKSYESCTLPATPNIENAVRFKHS